MTTEKTIKLSDEGKFTVFHRIAARKKAQNPDYKPEKKLEDDLFYTDEQGRDYVNPKVHEKVIEIDSRENAIVKHGNDKNKRLDLCGFPKKDRGFMFEYDYKSVLSNFPGKIKDSNWLFIYGSVGTGKTTLATRLVWEWMKKEPARMATFLSITEWMEEQHQKLDFNNENEIQYPAIPKFRKYVILDDFDKIGFTEWQVRQIFRLIDNLYRNEKKVIITSNIGLTDLLKKSNYDLNYKAAIDRLVGMTKSGILAMDGKSMRSE